MTLNHNFSLPYFLSITCLLLALMTLPSFAEPDEEEPEPKPDFAIGDDGRTFINCENFTGKNEIRIRGEVTLITSIIYENAISPPPTKPINAANIGFFYIPSTSINSIAKAREDGSCLIGAPNITQIFTFDELPPSLNNSGFDKTVQVENSGDYLMFYHNCEPTTWVTMRASIEIDEIGMQEFLDSIPTFFSHLRIIMFIVAPIYFVSLALWLFICSRNRIFLNKYHAWMSTYLLVQFLESICAMDYAKTMLLIVICLIVTSLFYICVFVLVQACFRVLRTFLTRKTFLVLLVPMILQGFGNMLNPFQEFYWIPYSYLVAFSVSGIVFMFVDAICSVVIIVVLLKRLVLERDNLAPTATSTRKLEILRLFFKAYVGFVVYHTILLQGMSGFRFVVRFELWWVSVAVHEGIGVVFFGFIFYIFRPNDWNAYILWNEQPVVGI